MPIRVLIAAALFALVAVVLIAASPAWAGESAATAPDAGAAEVPVLAHPVSRGDLVSAADVEIRPVSAGIARRALPMAEIVGKEAARSLVAGSVVREGDIVRPQSVRRGDTVVIAIRTGALSITTTGRALTGGAVGDVVRVLSVSTGRTLNALVEADGHVRVTAS